MPVAVQVPVAGSVEAMQPSLYIIPFVPIIHDTEEPFPMFRDLKQKYEWVLDLLEYDSTATLLKVFNKAVIVPALQREDALLLKKAEDIRVRYVRDYL